MIPEMTPEMLFNRANCRPIPQYPEWNEKIRKKEAKGKEPLVKFFERLPCQSLDFANRVDTLTGRRFSTLLKNKINLGSFYCMAVMRGVDKNTGQIAFKFHDALALNGYMSANFIDPEGKLDQPEIYYFTANSIEDTQLKFWRSWSDSKSGSVWQPEDVHVLDSTATLDERDANSIFKGLSYLAKEAMERKDYAHVYSLCLKALKLDLTEEQKAPVHHSLAQILLREKDVSGVTESQRRERHEQALRSLESACNTGYNPSLFLLAQCALYGIGGLDLASYAKYMNCVDPRFSSDIPIYNAIYYASYDEVTLCNCEKVNALRNIEPIFNYSHPDANIIMGYCYQTGYGMSMDPILASQLYFNTLQQEPLEQPSPLFVCLALINLKKLGKLHPLVEQTLVGQNLLPQSVDYLANLGISNSIAQLNTFEKIQLAGHLRLGIFTEKNVTYADQIMHQLTQN